MAESRRYPLLSRRRLLAAALGAGLPLAAAGGLTWRWLTIRAAPGDASGGQRRREQRPTLDPERFAGKAALAHRAAREIPDVLDELHCYCGCDRDPRHVSLLSCYTDGHAAT
jgi:hypothetical protein